MAALKQTVLLLALVAETTQQARAAVSAGDNTDAFATLCLLINAAQTAKMPEKATSKAEEILDFAAAINITLDGKEAVADLIANSDSDHGKLKSGSPQKTNCAGDAWTFCKKGATKLKGLSKNTEAQEWMTSQYTAAESKLIADTVQQIVETAQELEAQAAQAEDTTIAQDLTNALEGTEDQRNKLATAYASDNRQTTCGATAHERPGKAAGKSLAQDALCLCGKSTSQTEAKACGDLGTNAPTNSNADTTVQTDDWAKLKKACQATQSSKASTAGDIRAAIAVFSGKIAKAQGTGHNRRRVLGKLNGDGANGCDGSNSATAGGSCVYYGYEPAQPPAPIAWLTLLNQAADKIDKANQAAAKAYALEQQLISLNKTLASIATRTTTTSTTKVDTQPGTKQDKQQETGKQKECEKHTDKTEQQCKSLECDYDAENKKCKPKPGTEAAAAATGDESAGATTDKCGEAKTPEASAKVTGTKHEGKNAVCGSIILMEREKLRQLVALLFLL
uniref:Variant surface glycoprotein 1125.221 n=1 Tax=Trypanosoma brucei TaxID=5691 RepID=A0A1J0R5E3_9TRYP|nr:variant surface glycoprotein 1125.221 [Trypanosoma brucei]